MSLADGLVDIHGHVLRWGVPIRGLIPHGLVKLRTTPAKLSDMIKGWILAHRNTDLVGAEASLAGGSSRREAVGAGNLHRRLAVSPR